MNRIRKYWLYLVPIACVVLGLISHGIGSTYPRYSNTAIVELLQAGQRISAEKYRLFHTCHDNLVDIGDGLTSFGLSLFCFLLLFKVRSFSDLANLKSPPSKFVYLLLLNVVLILNGPALLAVFCRPASMEQNDLDGPGIFVGIIFLSLLSFVITNIVAGLALYFAKFPAYCFKIHVLKTSSKIIAPILIGWLAIEVLSLFSFICCGGIYMIPLTLIKLYLLSSMWGGLLDRQRTIIPAGPDG